MRKFSKRLKKMNKDKKNDNCNPVPNQLVKCTFMMVFNNCPETARNTSKPLLIHSVSYDKNVFYFLLSAEECTALQSGNNRKGNGNGKGHGKGNENGKGHGKGNGNGNGKGNGNGNRGNQNKVNQKNRKQEMEKKVKAQDSSSSSSSESESKETDTTAAGAATTVEPQLEGTTLSEVEIIDK
jgi:hypothetical protein